jgi:hypothetical protein
MSWSVTINNLDQIDRLPDDLYEKISRDNPVYLIDAQLVFQLAKESGLVSATLSGGRTPSMYGGADVVVLSIMGFDSHKEGSAVAADNFHQAMIANIYAGPDPDGGDDWEGLNQDE